VSHLRILKGKLYGKTYWRDLLAVDFQINIAPCVAVLALGVRARL